MTSGSGVVRSCRLGSSGGTSVPPRVRAASTPIARTRGSVSPCRSPGLRPSPMRRSGVSSAAWGPGCGRERYGSWWTTTARSGGTVRRHCGGWLRCSTALWRPSHRCGELPGPAGQPTGGGSKPSGAGPRPSVSGGVLLATTRRAGSKEFRTVVSAIQHQLPPPRTVQLAGARSLGTLIMVGSSAGAGLTHLVTLV